MINLLFMFVSTLGISYLLMGISTMVSSKSINEREKQTPFECGFNTFNMPRMNFSMRFFLIAIIFIIFDVEIALIIPLVSTLYLSSAFEWSLTSTNFFLILIIGILLEWKEQTFDWKH